MADPSPNYEIPKPDQGTDPWTEDYYALVDTVDANLKDQTGEYVFNSAGNVFDPASYDDFGEAVNAAIDDISEGVVFLPSTRTWYSTPITVDTLGKDVRGLGPYATVLGYEGDGAGFRENEGRSFHGGFALIGDGSDGTIGIKTDAPEETGNTANVHYKNIWVTGFGDHGVIATEAGNEEGRQQTYRVTYEDLWLSDIGGNAIEARTATPQHTLNRVYSVTADDTLLGDEFSTQHGNRIKGNFVYFVKGWNMILHDVHMEGGINGTNDDEGIFIEDAYNISISDIHIEGIGGGEEMGKGVWLRNCENFALEECSITNKNDDLLTGLRLENCRKGWLQAVSAGGVNRGIRVKSNCESIGAVAVDAKASEGVDFVGRGRLQVDLDQNRVGAYATAEEDHTTNLEETAVYVDTSSGPITVTLSGESEMTANTIRVIDAAGDASENPITVENADGDELGTVESDHGVRDFEYVDRFGSGWLTVNVVADHTLGG